MPDTFKSAVVHPFLKKVSHNVEVLKNYLPISNLAFVSKVVEKVIAACIIKHMEANFLNETLQSAYNSLHSIETALVKVHSDIVG